MRCATRAINGAIVFLQLQTCVGLRDEGMSKVKTLLNFASCPEAEKKGHKPLLKRDGQLYMLGNGSRGCIGTYTQVMNDCTQEDVKSAIKDMDKFYKQTRFGVSPWSHDHLNQNIVIYKASPDMRKHMEDIFVKPVNGIANQTNFWKVFGTFAAKGCPAVVWGGEVRDAALSINSMDTDVGWFCPQEAVVEVLEESDWGGTFKVAGGCPKNLTKDLRCKSKPEPTSYVQVGHPDNADEGFEGKSAYENILGPDSSREFTTNAMGYDPMHAVVLDSTGTGLCDTLKRQVSYASKQGRVIHEDLQDFRAWRGASADKMVRLLKLVVPPKKFCLSQQTFAFVGLEIFKSFFNSTQPNFDEGLLAMKHMFEHYPSRIPGMLLYSMELMVRFCLELKRIAQLFQEIPLQEAAIICGSSKSHRKDFQMYMRLSLQDTLPQLFEAVKNYGGSVEKRWADIQNHLVCNASLEELPKLPPLAGRANARS